MKQVNSSILLVMLCCSLSAAQSQSRRVDSLLENIYNAKNNQEKLLATLALCEDYKALPRDTLDYYAYYARDLAYKTNDKTLRDLADLAVAGDYLRYGWQDSLINITDQIVRSNDPEVPSERPIYFKAQRLRVMGYATKARNQEALELLYRIIREAEQWKDTIALSKNLNTIGSIAIARNKPDEAMQWLYRAKSLLNNDPKYDDIKAAIYVNMSDVYSQFKKNDSAISYINEGVNLFRKTGNLFNLGISLQRKSDILLRANRIDDAEKSLKEMTIVRKQSGDSASNIDDNLSLIGFYKKTGQIEKAIDFTKSFMIKGDLYARLDEKPRQTLANGFNAQLLYYKELADLYKTKGDLSSYANTLEQLVQTKDSFDKYNSIRAIAELQTEYDVQKMENTIIQQKLKLSQKNTMFYVFLSAAIFIFLTLVVWFWGHKKRERLKLEIVLEKEKLLREQSIAKAEEGERKRIAADLHDNLGAFAASILSNIDVIKPSIENANALQELKNNSQAMVSQLNDTIWALKKNALPLTAISDRIKSFINKIAPSYPEVSINVIETIENDLTLSPLHAFQIYRISQEAINNALKHSKAKEITVTLQGDNSEYKLSIADNGIGIKPDNKSGNGLMNMKERAKDAGCHIVWNTEPNKGTMVEVTPIKA